MRRLLLAARGGGSFGAPTIPAGVSGPYDPGFSPGATVLTQIHCHTTASDGSFSPAAVVADYLAKGYGALQLTDHDKVTAQPPGITTAIAGNELSPTQQHIIAIDSTYTRGATTDAQAIIDGIVATGGLAQIAHPKWYRGVTYDEMVALDDYTGFEIHNAKTIPGAGQNPVTYQGFAVDRWDQLLTSGRRDLWAFAVDDLHGRDAYLTHDMGRIHVFATSNTVANVKASLVAGNFVADVSNYGVTPAYPVRDANGITIDCPGAVRIEAWGSAGLLAGADADELTYTFEGTEGYVRLVAVGDYTEGFASLSDRWQATDATVWTADGTLHFSSDGSARRIILRRHREGDFEAAVDIKLGDGGLDQASLMFNVLNSSYFYVLFIGQSSSAGYNNRLAIGKATSGTPSTPALGWAAFTPAAGTWYRVKMAYTAASGLIQAKAWERSGSEPADWMVSATDTAWRNGAFGFRANYAPEFDNLYIKGFRTYYQPVAIDPA